MKITVNRIVVDIESSDISKAKSFYHDILGLDKIMDHGWSATYGSDKKMDIQVSFAKNGGSGTTVPDLSIEVNEVDYAYAQMKAAGFQIDYELTNEPWGVRRFYVRDPFGKLINILAHI